MNCETIAAWQRLLAQSIGNFRVERSKNSG